MAGAAVFVSFLIFLAIAPFARTALPPVAAFIPVYQTALVTNDLITAVLLMGQYSFLRSRALLVLGALALGREALSLRMVAVAAGFVLLLWPESAIGPSFQMSFAAVLAIIALSNSGPVRAFLAPREEPWLARTGRQVVMLFVTGVVIELAPDFAPAHVANILHLARAGWYDGLSINRSQDNFVVQFGDADAEDTAKAKTLGTAKTKLPAEFARTGEGVSFTRLPDVDGWAPEVGFVDGFPDLEQAVKDATPEAMSPLCGIAPDVLRAHMSDVLRFMARTGTVGGFRYGETICIVSDFNVALQKCR